MTDSSEMDLWISAYLSEWYEDFSDELDVEHALQFNKTLLERLQELYNGQADTQSTALSMITATKEQNDGSGSLEYVEAILFEAAVSSPLKPHQLAHLVVSLCSRLQDEGDGFSNSLAKHANESLNGPEMPSSGSSEDEMRYIQRWCRLNQFVAHLTLSQVCRTAYLMLFAFNPTFLSGPNKNVTKRDLNYLVPGAAAWIEILGKEAYSWSVAASNVTKKNTQSLFTSEKWQMWKEGFRLYGMDAKLSDGAQRKATDAWREMCHIEGDPGEKTI